MTPPAPVTALHHLLRDASVAAPHAPALSDGDLTLSFSQLWARTGHVAAGLRRAGVRPGERVAVFLEKRVETVLTVLACSWVGAVFVPVNPVLRGPQLQHVLRDCAVSVLVTSGDRTVAVASALEGCPALRTTVVVPGGGGPTASTPGVLHWAQVEDPDADVLPERGGTESDVAAVFYTSGSTGLAKGVVLSHRNLLVGAESVSSYLGNGPDDVILAALPLSFDAGFSQLTTALRSRAHLVLVNYLAAQDVVRACERHGVTGLTGVPPLWIQLVSASWPDRARARLRYFANTGGRMPRATLESLRRLFPAADPFLMYGLTEAFRSTYLDPAEVDRRPDSIGRAIPNAEILVVGADGRVCGPGEPGELVHRGPLVALGYWNDLERTRQRFRPVPGQPEGLVDPELAVWSGDTVVSDADGFLYFVGRTDEMIKTSGYRVSPTEVEEAAYSTDLVRDAVALGLPDEVLGQRIELVVTPRVETLRPGDVVAALRPLLPGYMVPRHVTILPELTRGPNGKYDRVALREQLAREALA